MHVVWNKFFYSWEKKDMNKLHKTKAGDSMMISQMEDDHLSNHIKLLLRKIDSAKNALDANMKISKFQSAMYGVNNESLEKKASKVIKDMAEKLYPYLAEAMLRGISFTKELQKTFERSTAEIRIQVELDLLDSTHPHYYLGNEGHNFENEPFE